MFVNGIVLLFAAAAQNRTIIVTVNAFGLWMIVVVLSSLFFGLPLYNFYMFPNLRDDIHGMVGDTTQISTQRVSSQMSNVPLQFEHHFQQENKKPNQIQVEPAAADKYKLTEEGNPPKV